MNPCAARNWFGESELKRESVQRFAEAVYFSRDKCTPVTILLDTVPEPGEGDCTVGEEQTEGFHGVCDEVNEYSSDEGNETSSDEGKENSGYEGNEDSDDEGNEDSDDEGNEGDEDNNDSEFENDFGGVTQEDNTHIYEGAAKGKGVEIKAKVKTTKAKASEVKEVEGETCNDEYYYDSEDPPTEESEEEIVTQTVTPPRKKCKLPSYNPESTASTVDSASTVAVSASVAASSNMPSAAAPTSRRNKQRKRAGGFGVYINQNTGAQILNPGGRGQRVLSVGRNASASAKKKQ
nr:uncharacterized protein LOC109184147 [Ipomoea trifida]